MRISDWSSDVCSSDRIIRLFLNKDRPGLGGIKLCKPGRFRNGIVQRSEPVHQAKLPSSPPVPDAALRDLVDPLRCHLARVCNQATKEAATVLQAALPPSITFGSETPHKHRSEEHRRGKEDGEELQ